MKWITALDLEIWAETIQARTIFPELIADLLRSSATEISAIRFPSADKGQIRGFDGVLEATGRPPYVPDGDSIWEFGVAGDAINKAERDYSKRTEETDVEFRAKPPSFSLRREHGMWGEKGKKLWTGSKQSGTSESGRGLNTLMAF